MLYDYYWHNMLGLFASLICFHVHGMWRIDGAMAGIWPRPSSSHPITNFIIFLSWFQSSSDVLCQRWMDAIVMLSHSSQSAFLFASSVERSHNSSFFVVFYSGLWFWFVFIYSYFFRWIFCTSHSDNRIWMINCTKRFSYHMRQFLFLLVLSMCALRSFPRP